MTDIFQDRSEHVLAAVVQAYVETARPVASQSVADELGFSSATIRNVFADLEKRGYLAHPHTSAGRAPTDRGYRLYVDRLMRIRELNLRERQAIEDQYKERITEVDAVIRHTAKLLSAMTRLVGVAVSPVSDDFKLDHFQMASIDAHQVMVILVTGDGLVREELVHLDETLRPRELEKIRQILNHRFSGRALTEIRASLLKEADESHRLRLALVQAALDLLDHALRFSSDQVYVEGASHLIEQPEFRGADQAGSVLKLVEERQPLVRVLGRQWTTPGLKVEIGGEIGEESLGAFSLVHIPYRLNGRVAGALAVLGPTRMPYDQVTPLLENVARLMEARLSNHPE